MSVSYFDLKDNGALSLFNHFGSLTPGDYLFSAAGVTTVSDDNGTSGQAPAIGVGRLSYTAISQTNSISDNTLAVPTRLLAASSSSFNTRFRINTLPNANDSLRMGWYTTSPSNNGVFIFISTSGSVSFNTNVAGVSSQIITPYSVVAGSVWYELLILVTDKAAGLSSIVSTASTPGAVSATLNQNGAYAFLRGGAVSANNQWVLLGRFDMSLVPTLAVSSGVFLTTGGTAGQSVTDLDYLAISKALS